MKKWFEYLVSFFQREYRKIDIYNTEWFKYIVSFLLWALSRSPLCSFTHDESFHDIKMTDYIRGKIKNSNLRFSLLSLGFGPYKLYLLTRHEKKWALFAILKRRDCQNVNYNNQKKKAEEYLSIFKGLSEKDKEMMKEFIQHQMQDAQAVFSLNSNKISIYTAISVMIITIIATYSGFSFSILSLLQKIIILILAYNLLNMIAYTIFFLKVQEVRRVTIEGIIYTNDIVNETIAALYYNMICLNEENRVRISTMLDIERYLIYFIIFIIVYFLIGLH